MSLQVTEIFYSIQGESTNAGRPCVFIRLTGCPLRCTWCDTEYAFHGGKQMTLHQILGEVRSHGCRLVEVTGGEPLAQSKCIDLLHILLDEDYEVMLETSGALSIDEVPHKVQVIMDLKCPDSGEESKNRWSNIEHLDENDELKFVISSREDFDWSMRAISERNLARRVRAILFSPVHGKLEPTKLAEWMKEAHAPARLQLQLHKQLWPDVEAGV
ncbi:MAG: 7-carboxy-7-deazaguanine synthase QueE [Chrysiogenetes bacterium]|nr:7-carboxy-7-deazaguanine synthase QueE [Chrysiogenetes bacterium]